MSLQVATNKTQFTVKASQFDKKNLVLVPDKNNDTRFYLNYMKDGKSTRVFIQFPELRNDKYGLNTRYGTNEKEKMKMTIPVYSNDNKQESVFSFSKNLDSFMTSNEVTKTLGVKKNKYVPVVRTPENEELPQKFNTKVKAVYDDENKVASVLTKFYKKEGDTFNVDFPSTLEEVQSLLSYKSLVQPLLSMSVWKYLGKYGVSLQMEVVRVTPNKDSNLSNNIIEYMDKNNNPFIDDSDEELQDNKSVASQSAKSSKDEVSESDSSDSDSSAEEEKPVVKSKAKERKTRKSKK
jgi:galactitol-specific phosphotransferase system IIB component